jgi:tetratricopeptide (TPR) repeat protein
LEYHCVNLVGLFSKNSNDSEIKKAMQKKKELRKLVKQKQYDSALLLGSEILQKIPEENDVLFIVGGIYYMKNKYQSAIHYFAKSLEIATHDTEVLILKANSHYKLGENKNAIECCAKIKEIDPKNKAMHELLSKIDSFTK